MNVKELYRLLSVCLLLIPGGKALIFPILLPFSIKITLHTHPKPTPPPVEFYYESVPVYKEVVIKPASHIYKQSYGDGYQKGTSYGDGQQKVYATEHHVKDHKYVPEYAPNPGSYGKTPSHYKGTDYGKSHVVYEEVDAGDKYPPATSHVAVPGSSYAEIEENYKTINYPKHHTPKGYTTDMYIRTPTKSKSKLNYNEEDEHAASYLDDSNAPYPEENTEVIPPLRYAGYGSSVYGDSYAKIIYVPRKAQLKLSITAYTH